MKIPKLFKKAAAFVMAAVTALSIMPATAFAAGDIGTISFSHTYDSNGNAMRYNSSANIGGYTAGGTGNYKYRMFVDGENAFCIQPGVPLKTGNTLKKASSDTWNALSANQKKAVGLALLYGYQGNRNNLSGSDDEKWLATQTLVWEFVTGGREATGSYNQTSTTVYSLHFGSNYANSGARAVYDQIVAMLRKHNTIPSFMSGGKNDITKELAYYYICGRNKQERGHHCDYKASLRKTDIEPLVIEAVKELVSDKYFAKEIEKRIGVQTDTTAIDKELANYESKLKEVDLNKARLEREIDNLPVDTRFRERKIHDMTLRLDALYDTIVELEERIEDAKLRKSSIEMETITLDNIYKLMLNFGKLYDIISDEEKKSLITYLIKEIQIYPNGESEMPLKSIEFNFPIYRDGQEVRRLLWEKGNTVECVVLMSRKQG